MQEQAKQNRNTFGDIRLRFGRLDVCERPTRASLGNELEAEDTVLGQKHIFREYIHPVDALGPQTIRKRVVAVEVLLERPAKDRAEAVGGERAGQDGHVAERALERLVCSAAVASAATIKHAIQPCAPRMFDILYSKFCAATSGLISFLPPSIIAWISPQHPPRFGSL
jgi:hypothetical protein